MEWGSHIVMVDIRMVTEEMGLEQVGEVTQEWRKPAR